MGAEGILVMEMLSDRVCVCIFPGHSCLKQRRAQTGGGIFSKRNDSNYLDLLTTAGRSGFPLCSLFRSGICPGREGWTE